MDEGAIGDPISFRMKVLGGSPRGGWPVPAESWEWHLKEGQSGRGVTVFDHGFHVCAVATYFLGPVDKVFAWIQRREVWPGIVLDSPATVIWKHREGTRYGMWDAVASPELVIPTKYYGGDEWVEITGSRGVIWVNRCSGEMLQAPAVVLYRDGETRAFDDLETDWGMSFVRQGQDFVGAIREGRPCTLTGPEARRVLQFVLAVHLSAQEERPVKVDEIVD
jgi:predicted dehydrogenase